MYIYRYGALQFSEPMQRCQASLHSFYTPTTTIKTPVEQQYCPYDLTDPRRKNDTCCNIGQTWNQGCPIRTTYTYSNIYELSSSVDLSTCNSPECTKSFLGDYASKAGGQTCPNTIQTIDYHSKLIIKSIRDCKGKIFGTQRHGLGPQVCVSDSDCDIGVKCDLKNKACLTRGRVQQETDYIACMLNEAAPTEADKQNLVGLIAATVNKTAPNDTTAMIDFLRVNVFSSNFCCKAYDIGGWYYEFDSAVAPRK